jgi:hypothetical protein
MGGLFAAQATRKAVRKTLAAPRGGAVFFYSGCTPLSFPSGCNPRTSAYAARCAETPRAYVVVPTPNAKNRQVPRVWAVTSRQGPARLPDNGRRARTPSGRAGPCFRRRPASAPPVRGERRGHCLAATPPDAPPPLPRRRRPLLLAGHSPTAEFEPPGDQARHRVPARPRQRFPGSRRPLPVRSRR